MKAYFGATLEVRKSALRAGSFALTEDLHAPKNDGNNTLHGGMWDLTRSLKARDCFQGRRIAGVVVLSADGEEDF